jgi:hypothetical protein
MVVVTIPILTVGDSSGAGALPYPFGFCLVKVLEF